MEFSDFSTRVFSVHCGPQIPMTPTMPYRRITGWLSWGQSKNSTEFLTLTPHILRLTLTRIKYNFSNNDHFFLGVIRV